ncbi:hypothetical protein IE077_000090 [Cardiosporidium cionae]|uniref:FCH domain-containing protein n=1 Tax=Cardiosporidium cionae TaxID=476202 RepID=A0ABQ7J5R5_9APIC|nr:hypothetical protein IE077_000090 [Cardiosporidium cionae]|eukprot:KAF8819346.1 hypothetical protein IE077_000090 [Cardiosporidium cionae]
MESETALPVESIYVEETTSSSSFVEKSSPSSFISFLDGVNIAAAVSERRPLEKAELVNWELPSFRVENGRRFTEKLKAFMLDRARLEEEYATGLTASVHRLIGNFLESKGMVDALDSLKNQTLKRASQSRELASSIRSEIVEETLNPTIQNHSHIFKQVKADGLEWIKSFEKLWHELTKISQNYVHTGESGEKSAVICQKAEKCAPAFRSAVALMTIEKYNAAKATEIEYIWNVKNYQRAIIPMKQGLFITPVDANEEVKQFLEEKRIVERLLPPDIEVVPWFEVRDTFPGNLDPVATPYMPAATVAKQFFKGNLFTKQRPSLSIEDVSLPEPPSSVIVSRLTATFEDFLDSIWEDKVDYAKTLFCSIQEYFQTSLQRFIFCKCLILRSTTNIQIPSQNSLEILVIACKHLLDWCQQQDDIWSGRTLMTSAEDSAGSSMPVNTSSFNGGTLSLQRSIYLHPYWNMITFWEAALIISISEVFQHDLLLRRWQKLKEEIRVKMEEDFCHANPCFGIIYLFGDYMLSFGISPAEASSLIHRVCKRLNLSEEFFNKLVKCIGDSYQCFSRVATTPPPPSLMMEEMEKWIDVQSDEEMIIRFNSAEKNMETDSFSVKRDEFSSVPSLSDEIDALSINSTTSHEKPLNSAIPAESHTSSEEENSAAESEATVSKINGKSSSTRNHEICE